MRKDSDNESIILGDDGRRYRRVAVRSALPIWTAAAVWLIAALFLPLYSLSVILITAVVSGCAAFIVSRLVPRETELVEVPFYTGNESLDTAVQVINGALRDLRTACAPLEMSKPASAAQFRRAEETIQKTRDAVIASPDDLPKIRKFQNYYLPLIIKLAQKYELVIRSGSDGELAAETAASIENLLPQLNESLKKQLDTLYEDDVLDISTDIVVLETMLARDNLK